MNHHTPKPCPALDMERNPERNPTLTRFYQSLPALPEGLEDGAIALCVTDAWMCLDEFIAHLVADLPPERHAVQRIVSELLFELDILGDTRINELAEMPYADYLLTQEWDARRRIVRAEAGDRCQLCNASVRLHVHHRTYDRRGYERWSDLIAICPGCHKAFHDTRRLAAA